MIYLEVFCLYFALTIRCETYLFVTEGTVRLAEEILQICFFRLLSANQIFCTLQHSVSLCSHLPSYIRYNILQHPHSDFQSSVELVITEIAIQTVTDSAIHSHSTVYHYSYLIRVIISTQRLIKMRLTFY